MGGTRELRGRQVLQLIVSAVRSLVGELLLRTVLLVPLVLNNLLQLEPRIFWLGGQRARRHGHAKDIGHHVRAQPAHQRSASRAVVGLLVVEEKPVYLQEGTARIKMTSGATCF